MRGRTTSGSLQTQVSEQSLVFVTPRVRRCQQFFSHKNGIGPGQKAQADSFAGERSAAGAEASATDSSGGRE